MADDSKEKKPGQAKKPFVVRDTPAWLDQHQTWISDGARSLYKTLRTLADVKTGRLFIPGRGWISPRSIERKAGIHEDTRLKYMKELKQLGAVLVHRDHVLRIIEGRERWVWGECQITVLSLKLQNPHKHSGSSTPGNGQNAKPEPQACVSSTPGSSTPGVQDGLLHPESSGPEETGNQISSNPTSDGGVSVGVGGVPDRRGFQGSPSQTPPAQNSEKDWEKIPGWNLIELTALQKQELTQNLTLVATWLEVVQTFESASIQIDGFTLPLLFENTYRRLSEKGHKVSSLFIEAKVRSKAEKARLVKALESRRALLAPLHEYEREERCRRDAWRRQYETTIRLADERHARELAEQRAKYPPPSDAEVERSKKIFERLLRDSPLPRA